MADGHKLRTKDGSKLYGASVMCRGKERLLRRGSRTHSHAEHYAAMVQDRLERWGRVDARVLRLPVGFRDCITNEVEIRFGILDRLKVLLGFRVQMRLKILCANPPGRVESSERLALIWPGKPKGQTAEQRPAAAAGVAPEPAKAGLP